MDFIDILNYQPFGNLRILHFVMFSFMILVARIEWKEWRIEKNEKKYKKRY